MSAPRFPEGITPTPFSSGSVAGSALDRLVAATGDGEGLTKAWMLPTGAYAMNRECVCTVFKLFQIFRHFDDALPDGLGGTPVFAAAKNHQRRDFFGTVLVSTTRMSGFSFNAEK